MPWAPTLARSLEVSSLCLTPAPSLTISEHPIMLPSTRVMDTRRRIERALKSCLEHAVVAPCPPRLGQAMRHAVFPGGARFRPELCLAVAGAVGDAHPALAEGAAVAI